MGETQIIDADFYSQVSLGSEWQRLRELLPLALAEFSNEGIYLGCNLAMLSLLGLGKSEVAQAFETKIADTTRPVLNPNPVELIGHKASHERKTFTAQFDFEGKARLFMGLLLPKMDETGAVTGQVLSLVDVTLERELRSRLQSEGRLLKNLLLESRDMVIEINFSKHTSQMRTPLPKHWLTEHSTSLVHTLREHIMEGDRNFFDKEMIALTNKLRSKSERPVHIKLESDEYALYDFQLEHFEQDKEALAWLCLRPHSETAKVAQPCQLTPFINHEINNLLLLIRLESCRALREVTEGESRSGRLNKSLQNIHNANERIINLVQALSELEHNEKVACDLVALKELFEELILFCGKYLSMSDVRVVLECPSTLYHKTHPALLQIVLVNLFRNALDAMKSQEQRLIKIKATQNGDSVLIRFEDTGCGVSEEVAYTLFDSGISTKGSGRGIGLHLSQVIMKKLGGSLKLTSLKPAVFEIRL